MSTAEYYGAIENLKTGTIYYWDGDTAEQMANDIAKLSGSQYNVHWKFAGSQSPEESNIFEMDGKKEYYGETAIAELAAHLGVTL